MSGRNHIRAAWLCGLLFIGAPAVAAPDPAARGLAIQAMTGVASLSPVAPSQGSAIAGQTSIPAPAAVPAATPWWVRVIWNGVVQRPGTDFTSDGSANLHLTFSAAGGESWLVEQLQRAPQ